MLSSGDEELVDECYCCDHGTFDLDLNPDLFGARICKHCGHHINLHRRQRNEID